MIASPITIEEIFLRFVHDPFDFIQNEIIEEGILLGSISLPIDPHGYHMQMRRKVVH